uniref:Ig-like domain-containing protein n=1 Tax=Gouania willdenowi TaxID=441366 RepID=A0A8C5HFM3_GOUWI
AFKCFSDLTLYMMSCSIVYFQTRTVHVKQDVTLTCPYEKLSYVFWIRIISGHLPEFLGGPGSFPRSNRISAKEEPGTFVLLISESTLNDTGLYYCVKKEWLNYTFVTGLFLKVKESDISSIIQDPAFYWFKSALNKSHPSFIYTHNDGGEDCHSSLRTPSAQRCFYSFSRNFSDAGIYHCAVAACGHILWGQGTHLNTEGTCKHLSLFLKKEK